LHGIRLEPDEVVRLTQDEVEAHPVWAGFGDVADSHPPMRGWLATAVCGVDGRSYGLLQLSDKSGGADFTVEDEDRMRELAAFTGGPSTLSELPDARGGLSHNTPLRRLATTALRRLRPGSVRHRRFLPSQRAG
jgi:hypothetical protein